MESLTLAGHTPVLYYSFEDEDVDGKGFNVLYADDSFVDRFATLAEAIEVFEALLAH